MKPFLFSKHQNMFSFTCNPQYCLASDKNKILFMDRWFLKPDYVDMEQLKKLRDKYRTIFFFNGNAGGGILRPEVLPYVDMFFNKSLFKDKSLYQKVLYGDELFTEHYHIDHGINDPDPRKREVITDLSLADKLKVGWNIGIGDFPKLKLRQRSAVFFARTVNAKCVRPFHKNVTVPDRFPENKGLFDIHARWGGPKRPTLLFHRNIMLDKIRDNPRFLTGKVPQNQYNKEIKNCKITLSPFGWGEVCFRDFEAVLNGSLLLKPEMGHLETWPDIFVPYETYVPFDWDGKDLVQKGEYYLGNEAERNRIVHNAFDVFISQARTIDDRLESILGLIKN
ncbi:MAG: glycosyltransferase family 1 protein [Spirochaetaceae bacterium]|nr:MAG: glycosyltransferase family 1 protein [Spirochaetaceae bacterium]